MAFQFYKESYSGAVKEVTLGKTKTVTVGGETCYPFYQFEGEMPHKPKIAMEVWDIKPDDWAEAVVKPFEDVIDDPAAWAKKCVEYGADMIALQLRSTDPNDKNASPADAVATVKKVLAAVDVPLIVWGTASPQKDEEVLKKIAEDCQGENLILGPVEDKNHKGIGAAAMGFGHSVISSSPIDVNLAKQVNILLENLGMPMNRVIVDPTTGGLGYGLEYTFSVMERLRMAAMNQGDDKLQYPLYNNLGFEVWKAKEAKQKLEEAPAQGDPERRGILMEAVGAVTYLTAGADILMMRHPEAVRMVRAFIDMAVDGGACPDIAPVAKKLADSDIDYASLAPAPDLTIEEEKAKAAPKKAAPKAAAPAAPKADAKPAAAPEAKAEPAAAAPAAAAPADEAAMKARIEAEIRAKMEAEAQAKVNAEAEAKAAEAKKKAEAEAKAAAEAEAKAKEEAELMKKLEAEASVIREAMNKARAERLAGLEDQKAKEAGEMARLTPEMLTKTHFDNVVEYMNWANTRP
ncbi:MAG: acetyl-CoA decarbonylase/synthase complex subunit delta [Desulfococcaceae bacterium]|nr:acetyl-CoA decarbonylase/synthase complex subunit delta [Desulfococcaceae bacterium]